MEEVDYQQSMTLNAHWEGFFDRESGVLFYQYGYDKQPLDASAFSLEPSENVITVCYVLYEKHHHYNSCMILYLLVF